MTIKDSYRIAILAPDFKPMLGGVAEYTFHLANELHKLELLDRVITPVPQLETYLFKVDAPKHLLTSKQLDSSGLLLRKLNSLIYIGHFYWLKFKNILRCLLSQHKKLIIISWIASPISKKWILTLQRFKFDYAIVLHGKDIITSVKEDNDFFIKACEKARLLIFNSAATLDMFQNLQPNVKTQHYILRPGLDLNYIHQFPHIPIKDIEKRLDLKLEEKLIILTVARLVKRKGVDLSIKALAPILKENDKLIYIIAGDGEEYYTIKKMLYSLGLETKIKLVGSLTENEKFALLKASSIFIMPNNSQNGNDFEGFGISFIEASYLGNIVIGGRNGGVCEAIQDGTSGYLVDTESDSAVRNIQNIISDLLANPGCMDDKAKLGNEYVFNNFQVSHLVGDFASHICNIMLNNNQ